MKARFHARLRDIPAAHWDALRRDDSPFLAHAFLSGLEEHGCANLRNGSRERARDLPKGNSIVA